jgi:uncharacterized protein YabE (DUF348 family)/3D (Asp-Asp-Asp) domain-containing protein
VIGLLAVFGFRLFPAHDVTVFNDGQAVTVSTTFDARAEALAAADVALTRGDRVRLAHGGSHASLAVERARTVVVDADGATLELTTHAETIGGALAAAGVALRPGDQVFLDGRLANARGPLSAAAFARRPARPVSLPASGDAGSVRVSIARARAVSVLIGALEVESLSTAATVEGLLAELGMTVREGDLVRPALDAALTAGMTVRLAEARTITVRLDGTDQALYTQAGSVADVLALLGVDPGPDELLSPPRETPITNGMTLVVGLNRVGEETVEEAVPPPTVYETDPSLPLGDERVVPGAEGLRQLTYRVTYHNGEVQSRELLSQSVVQAALPTRHITGTKRAPAAQAATIQTPDFQGTYTAKLRVRATWYNASHGSWARSDPNYGRTATGAIVDYGICAVDPALIPLHTRFFVPGYGQCIAADTGSLVKGATIDLGFPEEAGDSPWATREVEIYILD